MRKSKWKGKGNAIWKAYDLIVDEKINIGEKDGMEAIVEQRSTTASSQ